MATILVPEGLGDIYWALTILESFKKTEKLDKLDLVIFGPDLNTRRSLDYVKRFKIVDSVCYSNLSYHINMEGQDRWDQFHGDCRKAIIKDYDGFDYFIFPNSLMFRGISMEKAFPEYKVDWYPKMRQSFEEKEYGSQMKKKFGDYILVFFSNSGDYKHWGDLFSVSQWYDLLIKIKEMTGCQLLLTGREWDFSGQADLRSVDKYNILKDITGETSVNQLLGLIKNAKAFIGMKAGNTMLSVIEHTPTFMFYNKKEFAMPGRIEGQIHPDFHKISLPPDTRGKWHFPIFVDDYREDDILDRLGNL